MPTRLKKSWELVKQSLRVLKGNKRLLVFPTLSGISCLLLLSIIATPLWHVESQYLVTQHEHTLATVLGILALITTLFVCNLIILFCNAALIASTAHLFQSKKLSLAYGVKAARTCIPDIILWALFNTTIGFLLRTFQARMGNIAAVTSLLAGTAWTIVSYFVVPILVLENIGPIEAIKRSSHLLRQTWGDSLLSNLGLGLTLLIGRFIALLPFVIALFIKNKQALIIGFCFSILLLILFTMLSSAAQNVLRCALYLYSSNKDSRLPFDEEMIQTAFVTQPVKKIP